MPTLKSKPLTSLTLAPGILTMPQSAAKSLPCNVLTHRPPVGWYHMREARNRNLLPPEICLFDSPSGLVMAEIQTVSRVNSLRCSSMMRQEKL